MGNAISRGSWRSDEEHLDGHCVETVTYDKPCVTSSGPLRVSPVLTTTILPVTLGDNASACATILTNTGNFIPSPAQLTSSHFKFPSLSVTPLQSTLIEPQAITAVAASVSTATTSSSSSDSLVSVSEFTGLRVLRQGIACAMPLELYTLQPPQTLRMQMENGPSPTATLAGMFDYRFPKQTHDTTSIYLAAQRQQRLQKEKEPTRRSSTNVPPAKSCLSPKSSSNQSSRSEPLSLTKAKRKVSFADDRGLSLTEVRVMKNEINELPRWTQQLLFQSLPARSESTVISTWDPLFPQPASNYLEFRKRIEEKYVALENVIVKKDDDLLTGTIKVKNVTFEKHVFVRATFDCWSSYCDYPAIFVSQGACPVPAFFDTFSFSIKVPAMASRYGILEMCVGYKTPQGEYWDSNGGKNYKLASITRRTSDNTSPVMATGQVGFIPPVHKLASYSTSDIADWTDFSSWNQILSQGPYW
ncbi:protein phosphatase 1 regulatory subunit 3C-B isoform 1 [Tropilaelaps mercedesae]|uniref:Protein phosphatase 1 regulatory subunit 3C-B isoform 1 n=1 Tax=Tropilaelaps mercedesae TaxID=418985 RepID=A0A1V9XS43_9ACAR|nr:protein phosphatase 1 regulatory subunit 3C-B isoform 1 [Tropilaelaps mercedesae]